MDTSESGHEHDTDGSCQEVDPPLCRSRSPRLQLSQENFRTVVPTTLTYIHLAYRCSLGRALKTSTFLRKRDYVVYFDGGRGARHPEMPLNVRTVVNHSLIIRKRLFTE